MLPVTFSSETLEVLPCNDFQRTNFAVTWLWLQTWKSFGVQAHILKETVHFFIVEKKSFCLTTYENLSNLKTPQVSEKTLKYVIDLLLL